MVKKYYIKYKDLDGKYCDTKQSNRKFASVDEFMEHCDMFGIKWEYFKDIELLEDE